MDILLPFPTAVTGFFAFLLFLYSLLWISRRVQKNSSNNVAVPEPGGARPLIGHLHLLGGPKPAHITLGNMADKYGPIFMIKMGMHRALIVSNWEIAKECFTTKDKVFCNRPKSLASEILGYNCAMIGLSPYGPYWRQIRKIATLEILSNHRLEMLKHIRESEVKASVKEVYDLWMKNKKNKVLVEMKRWFGKVTLNVVLRMVVGKSFVEGTTKEESEENERSREALRKFFELTGAFPLADALPFMRWADLGGHEKAMKKTAKELDEVVEGWLREHKQKRSISEVKGENDFMYMMLSLLDEAQELPSYDADTINKATCLAMILGGTDTTTVTLTWAVALLLNNRHVLEKAQNELDTHVGRERLVQESDMRNLVYFQSILKETLRLYPAAPLSVPHESLEDCSIGGYHVPARTRLFVNLSKLHRDPKVWCNPCEFQPERFLTTHKDCDVRGQNFELLPFGSGRRVCPGISFALQVMQLTLAHLLQGFEFATPGNEPIDMVEGIGLTNLKATPLEVLLTPRLPAHIYQ
ncbi:hypothetical protein Pint_08881 [Pistacia integerrima]|uniref:Uncharacterized protein n=1 Tax=Pistacia integerrima TaxID=434235 RepID=A0ACC0XXE9_9ROSI|nr:hypothetical protein Pint_08881 [Pistacia integerrima]